MMNERDLFAALPTIDEAVSQRLHQRLVDVANAAGLLDVAYRTIETPGARRRLPPPRGGWAGSHTRARAMTSAWGASPATGARGFRRPPPPRAALAGGSRG